MPYAARSSRVKVKDANGVTITLLASRCTIHTNSDLIDVTNFESSDEVDGVFFGDWLAGITGAEISVEAFDADTFAAGDDVANDLWQADIRAGHNDVKFKYELQEGSNVYRWFFPVVSVIDVSSDGEAHGAQKIMLRFRNRGRWYYPGQAVVAPDVDI